MSHDILVSMEFFTAIDKVVLIRLLIALALGAVIGLERFYAKKPANMRTYALVSVASAMFVIVGELVLVRYQNVPGISLNPMMIASAIVTGIGFLGAGLIIFKQSHLQNLTTAAGLWAASAIGVAEGFGLPHLAIMGTILTLIILFVLGHVEHRMKEKLHE